MEPFKKLKSLGIFAGLILMAVGILFLIFNKQVAELLGVFVGLGILLVGVIRLIITLKGSPGETQKNKVVRIIVSVIMIGLGLFLLIDNQAATSLIGLVIGIIAFAAAFDRFMVASMRGRLGLPIGFTIFFGILHLIFGVFMIYASLEMIAMMVVITGIYMIFAGVTIIISAGFLGDFQQPETDAPAEEQPPEEEPV
ncbi:MAG: DUF308 domain-containing protein, partial [Firmicutes bacterium]|nr:DUF308 domain-containing protein [Bacillota bacterium]